MPGGAQHNVARAVLGRQAFVAEIDKDFAALAEERLRVADETS
jgi:hypothetical protein